MIGDGGQCEPIRHWFRRKLARHAFLRHRKRSADHGFEQGHIWWRPAQTTNQHSVQRSSTGSQRPHEGQGHRTCVAKS